VGYFTASIATIAGLAATSWKSFRNTISGVDRV